MAENYTVFAVSLSLSIVCVGWPIYRFGADIGAVLKLKFALSVALNTGLILLLAAMFRNFDHDERTQF